MADKDPKRVAAGRRSKRKGNKFEQEVALDLNRIYAPECLSGRLIDRPFRRTPVSGGFRRSSPADILCPPWFPFFIECKHTQEVNVAASIFHLLQETQYNFLLKVWASERPKALPLKKELLLVFKQNLSVPLCLTTVAALGRLDHGLASGRTDQRDPMLRFRQQGIDLAIVDWQAFLRRCSKQSLSDLEEYLRLGDATLRESPDGIQGFQATGRAKPDLDVRERYGLPPRPA